MEKIVRDLVHFSIGFAKSIQKEAIAQFEDLRKKGESADDDLSLKVKSILNKILKFGEHLEHESFDKAEDISQKTRDLINLVKLKKNAEEVGKNIMDMADKVFDFIKNSLPETETNTDPIPKDKPVNEKSAHTSETGQHEKGLDDEANPDIPLKH